MSILQDNLRSSVVVVRYSGEEFAVLLFNTGREEARRIADHLLRKPAEKNMPQSVSSFTGIGKPRLPS